MAPYATRRTFVNCTKVQENLTFEDSAPDRCRFRRKISVHPQALALAEIRVEHSRHRNRTDRVTGKPQRPPSSTALAPISQPHAASRSSSVSPCSVFGKYFARRWRNFIRARIRRDFTAGTDRFSFCAICSQVQSSRYCSSNECLPCHLKDFIPRGLGLFIDDNVYEAELRHGRQAVSKVANYHEALVPRNTHQGSRARDHSARMEFFPKAQAVGLLQCPTKHNQPLKVSLPAEFVDNEPGKYAK